MDNGILLYGIEFVLLYAVTLLGSAQDFCNNLDKE